MRNKTELELYVEQAINEAEQDAESEGVGLYFALGMFTGPIGIIVSLIHKPDAKPYRLIDKPDVYKETYKYRYISAKRKRNLIGTICGFACLISWIIIGRLLDI